MPTSPAYVNVDGKRAAPVTAWAGPWPIDERWWDPKAHQHLVRLQLVDAAGRAFLVSYDLTHRRWQLEAVYD
jgi:protein ImuB